MGPFTSYILVSFHPKWRQSCEIKSSGGAPGLEAWNRRSPAPQLLEPGKIMTRNQCYSHQLTDLTASAGQLSQDPDVRRGPGID